MPSTAIASPATTPSGGQAHRDRFLNFAFAAADLLVEVGPDRLISWAAGAFASRFGRQSDGFLHQPVEDLIVPEDRPAMAHGLALAASRGRLPPLILRLNDPPRTRCVLAALAAPGPAGRLCLSFGPVPAEPLALPAIAADAASPGRSALASQSEAVLRAGQDRSLNLLDVEGWAEAYAHLSAADRAALRQDIGRSLAAGAGPDIVVGDMGPGRFGVLGGGDLDIDVLAATLRKALGPGTRARVNGQAIPLSLPGLTPGQASRALRLALARFAEGGLAAVSAAGFAQGLAGFIATTGDQAAALRARIAGRRFRLAYQPVVDLADRKAHHFEALLRPFASAGEPAPSTQDLVTFAEATGLSEELDLAVAQEALRTLAETERVRVAVNVSGLSMQSAAFRDQFMRLVTPGARLIVELTETADITDTAAVADMLAALRGAGVAACIDDFGAGSAAFRYLRDFRVDYVKIDGGYVRAATLGPREQGFIESMRDLAHAVGAGVIAEMVETEAQASLMARLGVRYAQGYLFGRPGQLPGARRS